MANITAVQSCDDDNDWVTGETMIYTVFQATTLSVSVLLNLTLVSTICCSSRVRTTSRAFIASLAASDIAFSFYGIIHIAVIIYGYKVCRPHNTVDILNRSVNFTTYFSLASNYTNILLVSLERWLYIARPFLHERYMSASLTASSVALTWLCAVLINIDGFILPGHMFLRVMDIKHSTVYPCIHFLTSVTLCSIYIHLSVITRRQIRAICKTQTLGEINNSHQSKTILPFDQKMRSLKRKLKSIRLLVLVFGSFFVLLSPDICFHIYISYGAHGVYSRSVHEFLKELTYLHCCVNFCVFTAKDNEFRSVLLGHFKKLQDYVFECSCKKTQSSLCQKRVEPISSPGHRTNFSCGSDL